MRRGAFARFVTNNRVMKRFHAATKHSPLMRTD